MQKAVVLLNNISLKENAEVILENIFLEIVSGDFVYITGKVGSGKSTLMKSLYGEKTISEGDAFVNGYNLKQIKRNELPFLRRTIGSVFQDYQLLNDRNVEKNISFALECTGEKNKKLIRTRTQELSEMAGIEHLLYKMPYELSGGEQQLVSITRALMNDPKLIIADEPTANLDEESSLKIMNFLKILSSKGTAVIIATHDKEIIAKFPGEVYQINNKNLIPEITLD